MARDRDAEVDPRFDPVFQRGYDPKLHGARRPRSAPRHATAPVPVTPIREAAPEGEGVGVDAVEPLDRATPASQPEPVTEAPAHPVDLTLRARNPYRLALLVASVVSIAAGALAIWNRIGEYDYYGGFSGTDQTSLFRSQLIATIPVPLLTGGVLGLILWLAIGAIAHRRRVDE